MVTASPKASTSARDPQDGPAYYGAEVRLAREHAGMSQAKLAEAISYDKPYISRVENGVRLGSEVFAREMDRIFSTSGYFERLRHRVSQYGNPQWFIPYLRLERHAHAVSDYSSTLVMGALQSAEYADAVLRACYPREDDDQIKNRVTARNRRLPDMMEGDSRTPPPLLWVVLNEAALRSKVGSADVMAAQCEHLVSVTRSPNVTVQVLPFETGAPASGLAFTLLTAEDESVVLYSESYGWGHVNADQTQVRAASATYDQLRAAALSPAASATFIEKVRKDWINHGQHGE